MALDESVQQYLDHQIEPIEMKIRLYEAYEAIASGLHHFGCVNHLAHINTTLSAFLTLLFIEGALSGVERPTRHVPLLTERGNNFVRDAGPSALVLSGWGFLLFCCDDDEQYSIFIEGDCWAWCFSPLTHRRNIDSLLQYGSGMIESLQTGRKSTKHGGAVKRVSSTQPSRFWSLCTL